MIKIFQRAFQEEAPPPPFSLLHTICCIFHCYIGGGGGGGWEGKELHLQEKKYEQGFEGWTFIKNKISFKTKLSSQTLF